MILLTMLAAAIVFGIELDQSDTYRSCNKQRWKSNTTPLFFGRPVGEREEELSWTLIYRA